MQNLGHRRSQAVHIPVNVQFTIVWKVIVDNQRHLLDINTSGPRICWYQHSTEAETEQHGRSEMGKMAASNQELLSTLQINVNLKTKAAFKAISWRKKIVICPPWLVCTGKNCALGPEYGLSRSLRAALKTLGTVFPTRVLPNSKQHICTSPTVTSFSLA